MNWFDYFEIELKPKGFDGNPVERTKSEYPYSYDFFLTWAKDYDCPQPEDCETIYSDRLRQWDYKKYQSASESVWKSNGDYFSNRQPEDIEKFLSLYFGYDVELTSVYEGCNVSSGYPLWIFVFVKK